MEINSTTELKDFLGFYFSKEVKNIKSEDKNEIEKQIKESIKNINGAYQILEEVANEEFQLRSYEYDEFRGNAEKICFIIKELPETRKIKVFKEFFELPYVKKLDNNTYKKLMFEMLDSVDDEMKEKALSKANAKILLKLMSSFNSIASSHFASRKRKAYCKKYYEICKNAIELKNAK